MRVGHSPVGEDADAGAEETTPIGDHGTPPERAVGSGRGKSTNPAVVRNPGCNAGRKLEPKVAAILAANGPLSLLARDR